MGLIWRYRVYRGISVTPFLYQLCILYIGVTAMYERVSAHTGNWWLGPPPPLKYFTPPLSLENS